MLNEKKKIRRLAACLLAVCLLVQSAPPGYGQTETPSSGEETSSGETSSFGEETSIAAQDMETLGIPINPSASDAEAALASINVSRGTIVLQENYGQYEVTLPADQESVALLCTALSSSTACQPTVILSDSADPGEPGTAVTPGQLTAPIALEPGEVRIVYLHSTSYNKERTQSYKIQLHRTELKLTLEASEAVELANGKRGFSLEVSVEGGVLNNFQTALSFDPSKLALGDRNTGEASEDRMMVMTEGDMDFNSGSFAEFQVVWDILDNAAGVFEFHVGANEEKVSLDATTRKRLFRLFFVIQDESAPFDRETLRLGSVRPATGVSVAEVRADGRTVVCADPGMAVFSGLEGLYQRGDESLDGGFRLDFSSPYGEDVLLALNRPWAGEGAGTAEGWAGLKGTGISASEEAAALLLPEESEPVQVRDQVEREGETVNVLEFVPTFLPEGARAPSGTGETVPPSSASSSGSEAFLPGDTSFFYTVDMTGGSQSYSVLNFRLAAQGNRVNVWLAKGDFMTELLTGQQCTSMAAEFDENVLFLETQYGGLWDKDGNGRLDILLYDIEDAGAGGTYQGLFDPNELLGSAGNNRDVLHLDTLPSMGTDEENPDFSIVYSTMLHEGQHLAWYSSLYQRGVTISDLTAEGGVDRYAPFWINEGLSLAAEHLRYGGLESRIRRFNSSPAIGRGEASLTDWGGSGSTLDNYALSYLFFSYLVRQAEEAGETSFLPRFYTDYADPERALGGIVGGLPVFAGRSVPEILQTFYLALYVNEKQGIYGFCGDAAFADVCPQVREQAPSGLKAGGAVYVRITDSGGFQPAEPTAEGLLFAGITEPAAPIRLTVITEGEGTVVQTPEKGTYLRGESVQLTARANPGHRFAGWEGDAAGTGEVLTVYMTQSRTIRAVFEPLEPLHLTVESTEGGTAAVETAPNHPTEADAYQPGTMVTVSAEPAGEGWCFTGWKEKGNYVAYAAPYQFALNRDRQLLACFEKLEYLEPSELTELFPQVEDPSQLEITGTGEARLTLERGTMTMALADGSPIMSLEQMPKGAAVKLTARAEKDSWFVGYLVRRRTADQSPVSGSRTGESTETGGITENNGSTEGDSLAGIDPTFSYEQGSITDLAGSMEVLDCLEPGQEALFADPIIWISLDDYIVHAYFEKAQPPDSNVESIALSNLTVEVPAGRRLMRRTSQSGEAGQPQQPAYGYTGSVSEYDLYLLSGEEQVTLQASLLAPDNIQAVITYGSQVTEADSASTTAVFSIQESGASMTPVVITAEGRTSSGMLRRNTYTIHLHRNETEGEDPRVRLGLAQGEGQTELRVKARQTLFGSMAFTVDLKEGVQLLAQDGSPCQPGKEDGSGNGSGQGSGAGDLTASAGAILHLSDDRFEVVSLQYLTAAEATGQSVGEVRRVSVTLAPKEAAANLAVAEETELARLYLGNPEEPGTPVRTTQLSLPPCGADGGNWNVIYDGKRGSLFDRTILYEEGLGVSVTAEVSSFDPKKGVELYLQEEREGLDVYSAWSQTAEAGGGEAVQTVSCQAVAPGTYTAQLRKAGHLSVTLRGLSIGQTDVDLNALLESVTAAGTAGAELSGVYSEAGTILLLPGDVDGDGHIGQADRTALSRRGVYGATAELTVVYDLNGDGRINLEDLLLLSGRGRYGRSAVVIDLPQMEKGGKGS